ncbi:hypothetical protein LOY43_08605 [Pseudomonas sp. B21-041]|uniref:hypothetical protein n=1 Tax=Pseudomonas sp. B21-041 TaxID=2895487 RepID=UPI00215FCA72|nr:hypothetical protein [Pseudomonas sp. B21-041]UVL36474.1 hypothetical protein LOY43_08605 [Pseudomonas sp. B21-041]
MEFTKHPLFVGASAIAATIAIFHQYIVPIYEKQNNNKIIELTNTLTSTQNELKESVEKNTNIKNDNASKTATLTSRLESKIINLEASKNELEKKVIRLQEEDRFSAENPFPKGFREIKIFDDYTKVPVIYKNTDYTEKRIFSSTDISDSLFSRITYYQFQCNETNLVNKAFFHYKTLFDDYLTGDQSRPIPTEEEEKKSALKKQETLIKIFTEKFGTPILVESNETIFQTSEHTVASIDGSGLIIFSPHDALSLSIACLEKSSAETVPTSPKKK